MKILKRIFVIIEICILLPIWGLGLLFGWIIIGKNVMENTKINKILDKLINEEYGNDNRKKKND